MMMMKIMYLWNTMEKTLHWDMYTLVFSITAFNLGRFVGGKRPEVIKICLHQRYKYFCYKTVTLMICRKINRL